MYCNYSTHRRIAVMFIISLVTLCVSWTQSKEIKVALWGDLPYHGLSDDIFDTNDAYGEIYASFRDSINDHIANNNVQLTFHTGDIKSGNSPCIPLYYNRFADLANSINVPTLLTLGDNEWTDCHRSGYNPIERLQYARSRFYNSASATTASSSNNVLNRLGGGGGNHIAISHFGQYSSPYIENQYVIRGGIIFAPLHVVGSNNNFRNGGCAASLNAIDKDCVEANAEYIARDQAVIKALRIVFQKAKSQGLKGIMIIIQAHFWGGTAEQCNALGISVENAASSVASGYKNFMEAFMEEVSQYHDIGDVVVVHGDAHFFRDCHPTIYNNVGFVMVPGSADVSWILATMDSERSLGNVFSFNHIDRPFQQVPKPVPVPLTTPILQPVPVPAIPTPTKVNDELCTIKYKVFNGKTDAYITRIVPNEKIDTPPCDVNIEVVIRCNSNDGSQKRILVKDEAIRITLRRVIDMKVVHARTEDNGPYFLFGNNGTDIFSGTIGQARFLIRIRSFDTSLNGMLPQGGMQFFMGECV